MAIANWSREEFMLVMNLYSKIRYGQFNARNLEVIKLAKTLRRTPGAVAYKLVHFAGLDPFHKERGIKGLANPGNNAIKIYNEFRENWDEMMFESEALLAKYQNMEVQESVLDKESLKELEKDILQNKEGLDVKRLIKTRVNQVIFRKVIVANYFHSCTVCGLDIPNLLVAAHILKWSENEKNRLNPENGICFCSIHDSAFEKGYFGIRKNHEIVISEKLFAVKDTETLSALFLRHSGQKIRLPDKFYPDQFFLEKHFSTTFKG